MKSLIKCIVLILISFQCSKNKETNGQISEQQNFDNKETEFSHKVIIKGVSDDTEALQYVNLINDSYLFGANHNDVEKEFFVDSLRFVLNSVKKPQFMEFWATGDTLYRGNLFVVPGDSITFEIKNKKLKFIGKNADLNNFYTKLYNSTLDYGLNPYYGDLNKYKRQIKFIYGQKEAFFNQYILKNQIGSNAFINIVRADLKQEYLNNLISPRSIKARNNNFYYNDIDGLIPIIENEFSKSEEVFNLSDYFDNISIDDFKSNNQGLLSNHFFKNNLNAFIRYYFDTSEYSGFSKEKLLAEKEFIQKNFDGELEYYAIGRMISDYNKKGFGYSINNIEFMKALIKEYENKFKKPSFKKRMSEIIEDLDNFDFKLPENALNSKLISPMSDTITLKEIFSRSQKRIRVLDFWASWCPPCINDIKKGKSFKDKLSVENNVEWIYLSIDKDEKKWLKKSEELKDFLNVRNHYLVLRGENSSLAKFLKVSGIPRYVILNKQNKIVLNNAPKPSDNIVFKNIIEKIN